MVKVYTKFKINCYSVMYIVLEGDTVRGGRVRTGQKKSPLLMGT